METPELRQLNNVLTALRNAGVDVVIGRMYNANGVDYFIGLPENVMKNGHGFELITPGVKEPEGENG